MSAYRPEKPDLSAFSSKKRAEVLSQGASCLTCRHSKKTLGNYLQCFHQKKLNSKGNPKLVNQHAYCEEWKEPK